MFLKQWSEQLKQGKMRIVQILALSRVRHYPAAYQPGAYS
jgi:hypothetical protein